jgi:hypothetical protein
MSVMVGADSGPSLHKTKHRHDPKDWTFWKSPGRHRHPYRGPWLCKLNLGDGCWRVFGTVGTSFPCCPAYRYTP